MAFDPRVSRPASTRITYCSWEEVQRQVGDLWVGERWPQIARLLLCGADVSQLWNGQRGWAEVDGVWVWQQHTQLTKRPSAVALFPLPTTFQAVIAEISAVDAGEAAVDRRLISLISSRWEERHPAVHGWLRGGNARRYAGLHDVSLTTGRIWDLMIEWQRDLLAQVGPLSWPAYPDSMDRCAVVGPSPVAPVLDRVIRSLAETPSPRGPLSVSRVIALHNRITLNTVLRLERALGLRPSAVNGLTYNVGDRWLDVVDKGPASRRWLPILVPMRQWLDGYRRHLAWVSSMLRQHEPLLAKAMTDALAGIAPLIVAVTAEPVPPGWAMRVEPSATWRWAIAPALTALPQNCGRHVFETAMVDRLAPRILRALMGRSSARGSSALIHSGCHLRSDVEQVLLNWLDELGEGSR